MCVYIYIYIQRGPRAELPCGVYADVEDSARAIYIYIYIHTHTHVHISLSLSIHMCMYIYIEREREIEIRLYSGASRVRSELRL